MRPEHLSDGTEREYLPIPGGWHCPYGAGARITSDGIVRLRIGAEIGCPCGRWWLVTIEGIVLAPRSRARLP